MSNILAESPTVVQNYNIAAKYFDECFPVMVAGQHVANVFYSPSRKERNATRILEAVHGFGGSPVEFCMRESMDIASDYGYDKMALEILNLSATDGSPKVLGNMTLPQLRFGMYAAMKSRCIKKKLEKTAYLIKVLHSMANRAEHDLHAEACVYNDDSNDIPRNKAKMIQLLKSSGDEKISLQPYYHPAPGLLMLKYKYLDSDPTGARWEVFSKKPRLGKRTKIEPGMEFVVRSCADLFDIKIPRHWRDCFNDYDKFLKSIVRAFNGEDIDIFAGQDKFIEKVAYTLSDQPVTAILGTDDLYANHIFSVPFFKKLEAANPKIFSSHVIEGADHYFENKKNEFNNLMDRLMYERRNCVRG